MAKDVVADRSDQPGWPQDQAVPSVWKALGMLGFIVGLAGFVQVLNGWYPPRFGNNYWVYRVTGGTIDGLTIVTVAVLAIAGCLIALHWNWPMRLLGVISALLFVTAGAVYGMFLTNLPEVRRMAVAANDLPSLRAAVILTSVAALASMFVYAYVAWLSVRGQRGHTRRQATSVRGNPR